MSQRKIRKRGAGTADTAGTGIGIGTGTGGGGGGGGGVSNDTSDTKHGDSETNHMNLESSDVNLYHMFGFKSGVNSSMHYIDEREIVYAAGENVVFYNIEKKTQRILTIGHPSADSKT
jgi:hypothetical protein